MNLAALKARVKSSSRSPEPRPGPIPEEDSVGSPNKKVQWSWTSSTFTMSAEAGSENQKKLFEAIDKGDVGAVSEMLLADDLQEFDAWSSSPDINTPDENNNTALSIAVKAKDVDMASLLLRCGATVRGTLLTSVETAHEPMVRLILEHLKEKRITLKATVDAFGEDKDHLTPTTPLMYASRHNYHDIVKVLVEYGAVIPDLDVVLNRTQRDKYEANHVCLYWHQAITSESYLIYAKEDPIEATIHAAKLLQKNKEKLLQHRQTECQELMDSLDRFLTKYIQVARNGEEIEDIMWKDVPGGTKKKEGRGVLPSRVRDVLRLDFKEFISGQSCCHFVRDQWYDTWLGISRIKFVLWTLFVIVAQPFICLAYILLPFQSIRNLVKTPYVRFILNSVSKLYFIGFLLFLNITWVVVVSNDASKFCQLKYWFTGSPLVGFYFFYAWLFGMTWKSMRDMIVNGFRHFWSNTFNWIDAIEIILFWISTALFWMSYADQTDPDNLKAWDRYVEDMSGGTITCPDDGRGVGVSYETAASEDIPTTGGVGYNQEGSDNGYSTAKLFHNDLNPLLLSEIFFAVATILAFLSLFREFVANFFVGPLCVSLGGMITDIVRFTIIFLFVWLSFAMGMRQLYQSYHVITVIHTCQDSGSCAQVPFGGLAQTMESLFWSIFNPMDTSSLHVNEGLPMIGIIGEILYAIYMIVVVIVMLNALIAMMADTYERVAQNRDTEWKYERAKLMSYYMHRTTVLPPPFNVIPTVYSITKCLRWPCTRFQSQAKLQRLEEVEMQATLGRQNRNYETFIKKISERYASVHFDNDYTDVRQKHETQQMKSEIALLKEALHGIQLELSKNQDMLKSLTSGRARKGSESKRMSWSVKKK